MIDLSLINQFFVILIVTLDLWLGVWVYFANRKDKINQSFFLMTIFLSLWIIFCYFGNISTQPKMGLFLAKLAYGAVALFFIPFYFFFSFFLKEEKRFLMLNKLVLGIFMFLFLFTISTNLMAKDMEFTKWGAIPVLGMGKFFYFSVIFFLALFITSRLFLNYFGSPPKKRLKLQYFLVGLSIFVFTNLIFNVILPFGQKIPQYYYIGNYSAIFLLGFTAYAIVKRELFEIKVVLTSLLVGLIAILLLLDALVLTENVTFQLLKGAILIIFLYFGYLLIQSVMREIHYRERLQKANKQLKKLDRAKSEFISIASHQLRTPLSVVKGYVSMLSEGTYGSLPPRTKKPVDNVYRANERLIKLVNDLLSLSRIESGKIEIKLEKACLQEIISNLAEDLKTQAHSKNIYLRFDKPKTSLPNILIDEAKIKEVISNLIDNAIKYTAKGGVTITLRKQKFGKQEKAVIEIKDTGLGMTKKEISKIFQSFSRGTAGVKLYTGGAGLGLYIAKKFANMHGGNIKAMSEGKGKGSTFYIELPIKK